MQPRQGAAAQSTMAALAALITSVITCSTAGTTISPLNILGTFFIHIYFSLSEKSYQYSRFKEPLLEIEHWEWDPYKGGHNSGGLKKMSIE